MKPIREAIFKAIIKAEDRPASLAKRLNLFIILLGLLWGLFFCFKQTLLAQSEDGPIYTVYTTQLNDTLDHLAEKYLGDAIHVQSILVTTEEELGLVLSPPLSPGTTLFIPDHPRLEAVLPTPSPPPLPPPTPPPSPAIADPEPAGKIAFSFYNRALARRVWEIDLIAPDGSKRQVLHWNEVSEPALSPDGQYLAFRGWHDIGHILAVTPLNDPQRYWPIASFQEDSRPDWSHDGSRIVFASQRESDRLWRLYVVNGNGQDERILARADNLPLHGEDPAWSHRDDRIIYKGCSPQGEACGLWFITLDGVVSAPILVDPQAIQPDGSPTSEGVIFTSSRNGNWDIYSVNLDGSDLRQLTDTPYIDGMPVWSPDGHWIAFQSTRPAILPGADFEQGPSQGGQSTEDNWGLWIMRPDGSDLRQVFAFDGGLMKANRLDLPYGSRDWFDEQISWGN